jgi:hypothetical protein
MCQRGIVSDWGVGGKRKIGQGVHRLTHPMHSFSTSTKFVQLSLLMLIFQAFLNNLALVARTLHRTGASLPEENLAYF